MPREPVPKLEIKHSRKRPYKRSEVRRARTRRARTRRARLLTLARSAAVRLAEAHSLRLCTVDDVVRELARHGYDARELGPSLANIFRSRRWQPMPWRVWLPRRSGRVRLLRMWKLRRNHDPRWVEDPAC